MSPREEVLFEVRDHAGRRVVLTQERWNHVLRNHPDMTGRIAEVMRAVREPTDVLPGKRRGEEWFYLAGAGPSKWLKAIVQFGVATGGRIITAHPRRKKP